jgi:hypothetical protein
MWEHDGMGGWCQCQGVWVRLSYESKIDYLPLICYSITAGVLCCVVDDYLIAGSLMLRTISNPTIMLVEQLREHLTISRIIFENSEHDLQAGYLENMFLYSSTSVYNIYKTN